VEALRTAFLCRKSTFRGEWKTWAEFKLAVRNFNSFKIRFTKKLKQNENLVKKNALVVKAQELQESSDFAATTQLWRKFKMSGSK
jgi:hypothetical protein